MNNLLLITGFIVGVTGLVEGFTMGTKIFNYTLYALLFFIRVEIGANKSVWIFLKELNYKIVLIPFATIIGTFIGVLPLGLFLKASS